MLLPSAGVSATGKPQRCPRRNAQRPGGMRGSLSGPIQPSMSPSTANVSLRFKSAAGSQTTRRVLQSLNAGEFVALAKQEHDARRVTVQQQLPPARNTQRGHVRASCPARRPMP